MQVLSSPPLSLTDALTQFVNEVVPFEIIDSISGLFFLYSVVP